MRGSLVVMTVCVGVASCRTSTAVRAPGLPGDAREESFQVYPYPEARVRELVIATLLAERGIALHPTADPHILLSNVKSTDTMRPTPGRPSSPTVLLTHERQWMVVLAPRGPGATGVKVAVSSRVTWADQAERRYQTDAPVLPDPMVPPNFGRASELEAVVAEALEGQYALEVGDPQAAAQQELEGLRRPIAALADPPAGAAPSRQQPCDPDLRDVEGFVTAGHVMLLSDPLGTTEPWVAVDQLLCAAVARGVPVTLAMSISAQEQARLNAFLGSSGDAAALAALLEGPFWHRAWQDGRSSQAVVDQLERVRQRRAAGAPVSVLAVDASMPGNRRMAYVTSRLLGAHNAAPERLVVAVLGNAFVTRQRGAGWDDGLVPVGWRLSTLLPQQTHAFDVSYQAGLQWACRLTGPAQLACGTWPLKPGPAQVSQAVTPRVYFKAFSTVSSYGFDGLYYVGGAVTASLPAVAALRRDEGPGPKLRGGQLVAP